MTDLEENFDHNMMRFKNPSSKREDTILDGSTPLGSIRKRKTRSITQMKKITIGEIETEENDAEYAD